MRLLRFKQDEAIHLGAVVGKGIVPLDGLGFSTMLSLIESGPAALDRVRARVTSASSELALADATLLAPIERPGKYLAIGMNYAKHLAEADRARSRVMVRRNARLEMDVDDESDLRAVLEHDLSGTETGRWLRASGIEARFLPGMQAGAMSAP